MQIIKNGTIYLGTSIINKAIPFLLLPIMTHYLTPADYGILAIFLILNNLLGAFVGMTMHTNISLNYYSKPRAELAKIIGNIMIILSFTTSMVLVIILGVSIMWETVFSIPSYYLLAMPLLAFMMMVNTMNITILRYEGRAYTFGFFEITSMLINISVTVFLLVIYGMGWLSQVAGMVVAYSVFFLIAIIHMRRRNYLDFEYSREKIRSILQLSIPLIPHAVGGIVIAVSDRLFIERMVGLEAVGLYSLGYGFGMIVLLFTESFIKSWGPWFYKSITSSTDDEKKKIVKYTYIYIVGVFGLAILITMVAKFVLPFMVTEAFYGADEYILWISLGYAIQGVYQIFFPYLVHIRKTNFLAVSTGLAAILNLVLNYFLINEFGAIGAAYATIVSFTLSACMVFWYQNKNYPMPWFVGTKVKLKNEDH